MHNALTLYSPILTIKEINAFSKVGYDYMYQTKEKGYLYVLPIGYGQGWGRFMSSLGYNNYNYLSQAGKISMDYSTYFSKKSIQLYALFKNIKYIISTFEYPSNSFNEP